MRGFKSKILSIIVMLSLILQSTIIFNSSIVFADEASKITIDIGSKEVNLGDTSAVSIKLDKDYSQDSIVLKQICYDVFQETTLNYNGTTKTYEGIIKYEVEPECERVWSIYQIKVGDEVLDTQYLESKGVNISDYDVKLGFEEIYNAPKVRSGISTITNTVYSNYTVVLDPGHGGVYGSGYNWGGTSIVNDTLWEKDYNLQTAQATAAYLRNKGVNVIMTRDSDVYLSLAARSTMINHLNPDLTLSIHYNSNAGSANGTVSFYKYSEASNGIGKMLATNVTDSIVNKFGFKKEGVKTYTYVTDYGKTRDYIHMIREPHGNVSLVECCYLSHAGDQAKVNTYAKRVTMGNQIGIGIIKTLDYMIANNVKSNNQVSKVQNLKASLNSDNSVNLAWDSIEGSAGYQIFRGNQFDGNFEYIGDTTNTSFVNNTEIEEGVDYFYRVKAYKISNGLKYYGSFSEPASVHTTKKAQVLVDTYAKQSPSASSTNLSSIKKGTIVRVASVEGDWYKIVHGDSYAYIQKSAITLITDKVKYIGVIMNTGSVKTEGTSVREAPSITAKSIAILKGNTQVQIVEEIGVGAGWYKIIYGNTYGYIVKEVVKITSQVSGDSTYGTTTANVNMRTGPSTSYEKITTVPSGTKVEILGTASTGWYKVSYAGKTGYISNQYIKKNTTTEPETPVTPPEEPVESPSTEKEYGTTTGNVNMRTGPSTSYAKITTVASGTKVEILGTASTGWYKVSYAGKTGYISNKYIKKNTTTTTPVTPPSTEKEYGTTTANVNMRTGPSTSYAKITTVPTGTKVEILGIASTGWYKVSYAGKTGYISNKYIKKSTTTTTPNTPVTPPSTKKEYGATTANVNMRTGPSTSYAKITTVPLGTKVEILGVASTGWYKVSYAGKTGYISNKYIKKIE